MKTDTRPQLILLPNKEISLHRLHRWVFSGAVKESRGQLDDGTLCEVWSSKNQLVATAHYNKGSIIARVLEFGPIADLSEFYTQRIKDALVVRNSINLPNKQTNIFRLISGEGDGLPGLVVDVYGQTAVLQAHSVGMYLNREIIGKALVAATGGLIKNVFSKSRDTLPAQLSTPVVDDFLVGERIAEKYQENGIQFEIDFEKGQKTGFFIDQRDNRELLGSYAKGRKVLNTFCFTGGFSMYALKNGALKVTSVDSSKKAMEGVSENLLLNKLGEDNHESLSADVMDFLKKGDFDYDMVVLDPPAFAKNINKRHNALQAYKRLNESALIRMLPGSILFTFSCSQVVDAASFEGAVRSAAIDVGRNVRVLHRLRQPADHPVSIFHPEGEYLKGLVVYVE